MNDTPDQLSVFTVHRSEGGRVQAVVRGQTVTLDGDEAQQLASLPAQLRWLFALVVEMLRSQCRQERAG